jgi:hypothetical protein
MLGASFTYRENGNNEHKPVCTLGGCVGLADRVVQNRSFVDPLFHLPSQVNVEKSGLQSADILEHTCPLFRIFDRLKYAPLEFREWDNNVDT